MNEHLRKGQEVVVKKLLPVSQEAADKAFSQIIGQEGEDRTEERTREGQILRRQKRLHELLFDNCEELFGTQSEKEQFYMLGALFCFRSMREQAKQSNPSGVIPRITYQTKVRTEYQLLTLEDETSGLTDVLRQQILESRMQKFFDKEPAFKKHSIEIYRRFPTRAKYIGFGFMDTYTVFENL